MGEYNYLKPKASQRGNGGIVKKDDGQFMNAPPYPQFGGFDSKRCMTPDNGKLTLDKRPNSQVGKPI